MLLGHIKFFAKKLGITLWLVVVFVSGFLSCVIISGIFDNLFLRQPLHDENSVLIYKSALTLYAFAAVLASITAFLFIRKSSRKYALAVFWGSFGLTMIYHFSAAVSSHFTITSGAKEIAGDRPYCLSMPGSGKPPTALAFVEMPRLLGFMGCSLRSEYQDATIYIEKGRGEYERWDIEGNKRHKIGWRGELRALPCYPETNYIGKTWPRPRPQHIPVFIGDKAYRFPSTKTSVRRNAHLYYVSSFYTPIMLDISSSTAIYHLSEKSLHPTTPASEWRRKEEISEGLPTGMKGWHFPPSGPLYFETKIDSLPAANIVCASECFLRFYKEPFDYYVEIPKQRIESWRQIYDEVTAEVEGWRVGNMQSDAASSP